jgi:hypothetical protein
MFIDNVDVVQFEFSVAECDFGREVHTQRLVEQRQQPDDDVEYHKCRKFDKCNELRLHFESLQSKRT